VPTFAGRPDITFHDSASTSDYTLSKVGRLFITNWEDFEGIRRGLVKADKDDYVMARLNMTEETEGKTASSGLATSTECGEQPFRQQRAQSPVPKIAGSAIQPKDENWFLPMCHWGTLPPVCREGSRKLAETHSGQSVT
jgi:hypothetical protein